MDSYSQSSHFDTTRNPATNLLSALGLVAVSTADSGNIDITKCSEWIVKAQICYSTEVTATRNSAVKGFSVTAKVLTSTAT